ncbi:hypothetical protein [Desulfosporosinus youngiae]|uniref:Putative integral membrane protein (DUF2275) n=1 Tax=Desulfosporosinus youngiae DSM 17734 TaxID=768710 RepID=H5Y4T4_9FIRM|nr:hypothetical protein [Desulfosporosinus youngiae]EHQ89820.1 putative integral membrane protein (DUF2275) [Desulfosporosinus youngiae DSM 17734]
MKTESLPGSDKKWQGGLKTTALIGLILIVFTSLGISLASYKLGNEIKKDILSVKDIKRTAEGSGLSLTSNSTVDPADYKMGQVEPEVYQVKNFDGMLFIYNFSSVGERNTAYDQWEESTRQYSGNSNTNMFSSKENHNLAYAAKNTITVLSLRPFSSEEYVQKISSRLKNLEKWFFYNLNEGDQIVYQGEGENWKGKLIVNYYDNLWTDAKGAINYDSWTHEQPILEFKGDAGTIQGNFSYDFECPGRKFGVTHSDGFNARRYSEKDMALNYGGVVLGFGTIIHGSSPIPSKDAIHKLTVKWNNKQETFELKAFE